MTPDGINELADLLRSRGYDIGTEPPHQCSPPAWREYDYEAPTFKSYELAVVSAAHHAILSAPDSGATTTAPRKLPDGWTLLPVTVGGRWRFEINDKRGEPVLLGQLAVTIKRAWAEIVETLTALGFDPKEVS